MCRREFCSRAVIAIIAASAHGVFGQATTQATPQTAASRPDLSSPQAALMRVYQSLRAGDVAAAKACLSFSDATQEELFDLTYMPTYGSLKLMRAMESRFGDAGKKPFASEPLEKSLDALIEKVKSAEIDVQGDKAVVVNKKAQINPNADNELSGIAFKKEEGQWKVVAGTLMDAAGVGGEMPADQKKFMRAFRDAVAAGVEATWARVAKGDFKDADEAFADYQARVQEALKAATANGR